MTGFYNGGRDCLLRGTDWVFNPLNAKLNPICHLLEMLGAHPILYISRIRVKSDGYSVVVKGLTL